MAKKPTTRKTRTAKKAAGAKTAKKVASQVSGPDEAAPEDAPAPVAGKAAPETVDTDKAAAPRDPVTPDAPEESEAVLDDLLDDDEHRDEHGSPLSRKILTGLMLLLAGGGIALWGAPKLASKLPSGLAPVASWLTPGQGSAQKDIAALRAELDQRLDGLQVPVDEARVGEIVIARIVPTTDALSQRVDQLSDRAAAEDVGAIEARLAVTETRLEGLASEIASLSEQLSNFTIGNGEMTAEAAGQIAGYRATVDGLRAEIEELSSRQGALTHRIDTMEAINTRRVDAAQASLEAAQTAAAQDAGLAGVAAGLAAGAPFEPALADLAAAIGLPVPDALVTAAKDGVPTLRSLLDGFPEAAHAAIAASIGASAGDGTLSRFGAFVESRVATRSLTPQEGMTPDAILSRMEAALKVEDLATVLAEAQALPSEATAIMAGWLADAKRRHTATDAFARLTLALAPSN